MPPCYVIGQMSVTDADRYDDYRPMAAQTVRQHGGEYLVRGGDVVELEGSLPYSRKVVLRFKSREAALGWYNSPEYTEAREIRQAASVGVLFLVDGADS